MKPTTEDFLIPLADVLRIHHGMSGIDDVNVAAKARIHAAIAAKAAHDEECQRMADEWVEPRKPEFFEKFESFRMKAVALRHPYGHKSEEFTEFLKSKKSNMWMEIRSAADPIFRDYISETPPTE